MNETEYLLAMHLLNDELDRAASAEPHDPGAHGDIITKIGDLELRWSKTLAERRRIKNMLCAAAILFALYLVFLLLYELLS